MIGPRFVPRRLTASSWVVEDTVQIEERFNGIEAEAKAVAATLHRVHKLHLMVDAQELSNELGMTLSKLADAEEAGKVYNLLIELVDSVVQGGEPERVARQIVKELNLGSICPRCEMVYLGQSEIPECCELCDTELEREEAA